ncbi:hypothetical protein [Blastococcus sp. SYSU D01042]
MSSWVQLLLLVAVGGVVGAVVAVVVTRRAVGGGAAEAALRVVDGVQEPLSARWRHGVVLPSRGHLRMRPGGPGGVRIPRGRPFEVPVLSVHGGPRRRPSRREFWSINPRLDVVRITTPTATVELAARSSDLDRVLAVLDPPGR